MELTLSFGPGLRIIVPDDLKNATAYVLREQGDWFENELRFVREMLSPGGTVIDIGANFGVYTLSGAAAVGAQGRVVAFEPTARTAGFLRRSVALGAFAHVTVIEKAVSDHTGSASLLHGNTPELNRLAGQGETPSDNDEVVALTSLDASMAELAINDPDFIKIDTEGHEEQVLAGGQRTFADSSPLVMFEADEPLRDDANPNRPAAGQHGAGKLFLGLGYDLYRLVPGLNVLAPINPDAQVDGFVMNLFACKPSRARQLAARGLLIERSDLAQGKIKLDLQPRHLWQNSLLAKPYAQPLLAGWARTVASGRHKPVEQALALHAYAHDPLVPLAHRFVALLQSLNQLQSITPPQFGAPMHLLSLGRVAVEAGARVNATHAFGALWNALISAGQVNMAEPFLAPSEQFEAVHPGKDPGRWLESALMDAIERFGRWSSYYTAAKSMNQLTIMEKGSFLLADMRQRKAVLQTHLGRLQQLHTMPDPR